MGSRYRKQEEQRIELTDGDWLLVRRHLTAGEEREAHANIIKGRSFKAGERPDIDPEQLGIAQAVAYLLDWSLTDADGAAVVIRDRPYAFVASALKNQTPESLREILSAIDSHDTAMAEEREREKKVPAGANG